MLCVSDQKFKVNSMVGKQIFSHLLARLQINSNIFRGKFSNFNPASLYVRIYIEEVFALFVSTRMFISALLVKAK